MRDAVGREIDYMRISITDRCNLRCRYCMPDGVKCMPKKDILTLEEIREIAECSSSMGISRIKLTGGEPLVRKDCIRLVRMLKAVPGIEKVTITTNGVLLDAYLDDLIEAGIDGINVSLDTLDRDLYREITGFDRLDTVLAAIRRTAESGVPVKINAVSVDFREISEGGNESAFSGRCAVRSEKNRADEEDNGIVQNTSVDDPAFRVCEEIPREKSWRELVRLAKNIPVDVRFIEMMPIGYGKQYRTIDHKQLLSELRAEFPDMERDETVHGAGPAVYYRIPGYAGSVGLISAIHGKFCDQCNRVRLTAQGYLKTCLCYEDGTDLRDILRGSYEEEERKPRLCEAMAEAIHQKPVAHCFERLDEITEAHNMSEIGG